MRSENRKKIKDEDIKITKSILLLVAILNLFSPQKKFDTISTIVLYLYIYGLNTNFASASKWICNRYVTDLSKQFKYLKKNSLATQ